MNSASPLNAYFDIGKIAASLPEAAGTMLVDTRLTDEEAASCRVLRVLRPVPAHYHATCDEYLYLLSGRALFSTGQETPRALGAGQLIFFKKGVVHATHQILEEPLIFLAVDTPRRDPSDVHFVNPEAGSVETFMTSTP
jgi:mannose-6-phosphate isomerase-like protein (cupin superfamily)